MASHYVYIPILVFCTPLIVSVLGTFTLLAILTSSLALFVISIRLGFLAIEFSGGFVLDFIRLGVNKITLEENYKKKKNNVTKDINESNHNKSKKQHHVKHTSSSKTSVTLLEKKTTKFYSPKGTGNNFISHDDYFMVSMIPNKQRPNSRRARSDYFL